MLWRLSPKLLSITRVSGSVQHWYFFAEMVSRPNIQARNSSGKQVSLLNDESGPASARDSGPVFGIPQYGSATSMERSHSYNSGMSTASSPRTPALFRSDSYDSQITVDPVSPITPLFMTDHGGQSSYTSTAFFKGPTSQFEERIYEYPPPGAYATNQQYSMPVRPAFPDSRTSSYAETTYEEDPYHQTLERGTKRYPCRYRDTHHCEKTFTTSGHASRHSKIHTAEKAVHCTYQGCQKKFTRADNMKQHLETHYKSKNGSSSEKSSSKSSLTAPSGIRKSVPPSRSSRPSSRNHGQPEYPPYDPALYAGVSNERYAHETQSGHPSSPYGPGSMGPSNVHNSSTSRPMAVRTENSSAGLDVLANVAALQS